MDISLYFPITASFPRFETHLKFGLKQHLCPLGGQLVTPEHTLLCQTRSLILISLDVTEMINLALDVSLTGLCCRFRHGEG